MSLLCSVPLEKPSIFSRELTDTTVTEGEELTLVCEITTLDGSVCWTKDGKVLRPSARCQLSQEGHRAQLIITGATKQDGGRYRCEAGDSWSSSIVRVHGKFPGSCPCLGAGPGPMWLLFSWSGRPMAPTVRLQSPLLPPWPPDQQQSCVLVSGPSVSPLSQLGSSPPVSAWATSQTPQASPSTAAFSIPCPGAGKSQGRASAGPHPPEGPSTACTCHFPPVCVP